ncbi:benzoyl-CoA reductase/2-hydroxyglutaryl-CoA dehydratase subunit BcrC/BadD/HgdB [Clostridium saccharobutylicum]|uniref:2-hydroxyacyl-CoA dehydratase family protein n=1 Tax=Clostridium saccharobutylicum TaxID=169679 RepID=UPI0024155E6E|nr:2-hydroxyacyl-CoA dehydratase family protein [Clostridium saccharobutylicum]NSA18013.1 benzoyl-CoA reductase/2-hydroxyglutaryl-CoA dehydratase subunit BcrC/BadD/HgdB [Clostridium saccharobutylicum]
MYEYLSDFKPVHVMELPNSQSEDGLKLWKNEIIKLKSTLEEMFDVQISEDDIRKLLK